MSALVTLAGSCYFPALYVLPFYLPVLRELPRNHPKTIWRRMTASIFICAAAWVPTYLALQPGQARHGLAQLLGLRGAGLAASAALPLGLTAALFAGPLYLLHLESFGAPGGSLAAELSSRVPEGPAGLRNLVVAPLTEEFIFRSCLVSFLLARRVAPAACALLSPFAFGAAHLHHLYDLVRFQGWPLRRACLAVLFQLAYTTIFGWYAAFLLLRTGSLAALVPVHAFCNLMGFPQFGAVPSCARPRRAATAFVGGVATFTVLLRLLTAPGLYGWPPGQSYASLFGD